MIKYGIDKIARKISELKYPISYVSISNHIEISNTLDSSKNVLFIYYMDINNIEKIKRDLFSEMSKVTIANNGFADEWFEIQALNNKLITYKYGEWKING